MARIAVDTLGGEASPGAAVEAAAQASLEGIEVVLVGHVDRIQAELDATSYDPRRISVRHCTTAGDEPVAGWRALLPRRDSAVVVAARLVAEGEADALVTAGPPTATVLAVSRSFARLAGAGRLGLASVYPREIDEPGQDPFALIVDVGAAVRCEVADLVAFARLGSVWSRLVSGSAAPRIGLLNSGTGEDAGGDLLVETHRCLRALPELNFVGNLEGSELTQGRADVVVCEGLLGNVVIKLLESIEDVVAAVAQHGGSEGWRARLGIRPLAQQIARLREISERPGYAGAPILGVRQICLQLHRRSRPPAFRNALKLAAKAVRDDAGGQMAAAVAGRVP